MDVSFLYHGHIDVLEVFPVPEYNSLQDMVLAGK